MAKQKENYLDYVPKHNSLFEFRDNKKGHVEIKVHNKGLFNRIAQLIAKKPKYSYMSVYASLQRYFIKISLLFILIRLNKNNINKMF